MEHTKIYELISYNIDIKDGNFINTLFSTLEKAKDVLSTYSDPKNNKNEIIDMLGELDNYKDTALHYEDCYACPAIYHTSNYGNYRMVAYIRTRTLH
jgi:hypothetical protein